MPGYVTAYAPSCDSSSDPTLSMCDMARSTRPPSDITPEVKYSKLVTS
jgi:hypothetical protein